MKIEELKAYELLQKEHIADLNSDGALLIHKKTGAKVCLLSNDDDNKVFCIGFRTPPSDSTGVPHIMEHSVLCGSQKFPAKDPFVELAKGSLNTFLNAMTYPDKTVYPVASCNDADFANLMDVYLDAVFHPNIYAREEIFKQEGWHYELNDAADPITVNGVVYNEMRGVFSSPDDMLDREIFDTLFPDTPYAFESGGDPQVIPELTYEEFIAFHKKYYHPSNSYIYLYGDMDMAERLDYLDRAYLSNYEKLDIDSEINLQKPFSEPVYKKIAYSITNEEPLEDNTYLSYTSVVDTSLNRELYLAFQIIEYALLLAPGAILNQTLLDRGIGKDIQGSYECGTYQPYFSVVAKNANEDRLDEFLNTVKEVYTKVAKEGFDKKALLAGLNFYEFRYREADYGSYPKGLMYGLQAFDSWLYDYEKPFLHIAQNDTFAFLKERVNTHYFEDLVERYLLNNNHAATVVVVPERGLSVKLDEELAEKLSAYKASLSDSEITNLVNQTKALHRYQEEPSTKEELNSIPLLKISDIRKETLPLIMDENTVEGMTVLTHDIFTNGIGYLTLNFDITGLEEKWIPYVGYIKNILGLIDTEHYTYADLFNEINMQSGGITFGTSNYVTSDDAKQLKVMFEVRAKVLYDKLDFAFGMIREVLFASDFSDKKRLRELISMLKSRMQASMPQSGHSTAIVRAMSYCSKSSYFNELSSGIAFYRLVDELETHFDERVDEFVANMKQVMGLIFCRENLITDYIAEVGEKEHLFSSLSKFANDLPHCKIAKREFDFKLTKKNEGFKTSSKVQYVALVGDASKKGYSYTGALRVLKVIMGYDYLWNNIRVLGGAYGCMTGYNKSGMSYFVSYRDPNLDRTLEVYKKAADHLRSFSADERDMTKYIIGAIADMDVPLTPAGKGGRAMTAYFNKDTYDMLQKERDEVLGTTMQVIRGLADYVDAFVSQNAICVLGGEDRIEQNKNLFEHVENLF